jgi:ribonuclease G
VTTIDRLLVDRGPGETRVAAMDGDRVIEVHHHRHGQPGAGALYRGRVGKPLPDASSVFVEIGLDRAAILPCGGNPPAEGSVVDVRIVQPPRGGKGAKVASADPAAVATASALGTVPSGPGVIAAAQHPVAWCAGVYGETLNCITVTPHDVDGAVKAMVESMIAVDTWQDSEDLFEHFGVDAAIECGLEPATPFPGGGTLIIEPTAALTAVDIDAGPMPASKANAAAIDALALELRLRAIAGPVIVDLIPSPGRAALVDRLAQAVAGDPVSTRVSGLTPEGRIELNRRRLRPSLADLMLEASGAGRPSLEEVAYGALRRCVRDGLKAKAVAMTLKAHGDVVTLLRGQLRPALDEAESVLKMSIALQHAPGVERGFTEILS